MRPEFPETEAVMNEFTEAIVQSAISVGISSSSQLIMSGEVKRTDDPHKTIFESLFNEYWYYLAYGRGPSKSGSKPGKLKDIIREWIRENNIIANERDGITPTEEQLIYLITRKLHREGYKGRDFVTPVMEAFEAKLQDAWQKDLEMNIKKLFV